MNLLNLFRSQTPDNDKDAPPCPPLIIQSYGLSDRGLVRATNEDCFVIAELARALNVHHTNIPQSSASYSCHRGHVFLVADGVGGHSAGEVASELSVKSIEEFLLNTLKRFTNLQASEEQNALRDLQNALFKADARIFEETAVHPEWRGMGTTLTMAFAVNWRLFVAHAGDSRCYLMTAGKLQRLTDDHTMSAEMVRRGMIPPEKEAEHPFRHIVTNILGGTERGVRVELHRLDLHPHDLVLLCSDGLTEMVSEECIAAILREEAEPKRACERLTAAAKDGGGKDNITVIVARIQGNARG
jgi:serine/threonine protein phosphatase PrpC